MSSSTRRKAILDAFQTAVHAVSPARAFNRYCRIEHGRMRLGNTESIDLDRIEKIWLVGAGKASFGLAAVALERLGSRVAGGTISVRAADGWPDLPGIDVYRAGHPSPDETSPRAADRALEIVSGGGPRDLILCLLSGGASSLWAAPPSGIPLADLQAVTTALLRSGAAIEDLNIVRKRLSLIAGGRLARAARARLVTLAISDVGGASPDVIGSGPTLPDRSTPEDAIRVLRERHVDVPESVRQFLSRVNESDPDGSEFTKSSFHVIASIDEALEAAARSLRSDGYLVETIDRAVRGESRDLASVVVAAALSRRAANRRRVALLWGGETTVTVTGNGIGGRNQELALAAARGLVGHDGITIASLATDGSDGPTSAAGGFADSGTMARAEAAGRDSASDLRANDSHPFLAASGDLATTGPTGTNVTDLIFALVD